MAAQLLPFDDAAIAAAARVIRDGGIVAVPTETVYGLAADATNASAVARIYAAKGRPDFNPLIVHVADVAAAEAIATLDDVARDLAARYWPGSLTQVLPLRRNAGIAAAVTAGLDTIAVRVPAHRAMRALIEASGCPLAAPSANASGAISPTLAEHVAAGLGDVIDLIIDDGPTERGLESTIVMGRTILRPGPIVADDLVAGGSAGVVAPGQLASHYAPSKPLRLDATDARADEWMIGFGPFTGDDTLSPGARLEEAAANLFAALHRADASDRRAIAVAPIPSSGIGIAINDRLRRAAVRRS